jgi:hypothetical protein
MWKRNLVFLGLVGMGVLALAAALYPRTTPPRVRHFAAEAFRQPEFRGVVDQVNTAFRKHWAMQDVEPVGRAPELAVARRLSLGLTGTIPSLQEIRQFEKQPADERVQWWLAGILQDQRYADYLGERLARAYVGTEDGPFLVYRRRRFVSWLSDQVMKNTPYDRIARELIADEGLWTDKPATNFVTVTIEPANMKGPNPERLAARVSRAFLGIRLDCAQCHNHPFEKWKQTDFHGLAAYFGQVENSFTGIRDGKDGDYEYESRKTATKQKIDPRVPFLGELLTHEGSHREQLAAWVTDPRNSYFSRAIVNRIWALLFGKPLVEPVDNLPAGDDGPPALTILANDLVAHQFDLQRLLRVIAATEVFQLDSASDKNNTIDLEKDWAAFPISRLRPEQVVGSVLQASSLETINAQSHIITKLQSIFSEKDFVKRYGDTGEDEFDGRGGTIPQRLLLMNGELIHGRLTEGVFGAATRIAGLAPDDRSAVRLAYLTILSREPTAEETAHFEERLAGTKNKERQERMQDIYWALLNSSEFSWNH